MSGRGGVATRTVRGVAAACAFAAAARAQVVRGVVVQPDSVTPAAGIIVVAVGARGDVVARALSGDRGAFELRVPAAGPYHLQLLRIGYRPTVTPPVDVPAGDVSDLRLVLGAAAVMLSAVTVRSDNVCGTTNDSGRVVAEIWEEARKALTATQLSVNAAAIDAEWQAFQFSMDRNGTRAKEQSVLRRTGLTERPFVSVAAEELARDGYVVADHSAWLYRAPDADALLSNQFAATHCFRVEAMSRTHPQWIGVAFRPVPGRDIVKDIVGMLWIDRATSELRLLEFRYTNLPAEADDPAVGGFVEFARMSTGHWLVARWAIRTPHLVRRSVGSNAVPGGGRQDLVFLQSITATGGELISVSKGGARLYDADRSLLAVDDSPNTAPARPSACGAMLRAGITLTGATTQSGNPRAGAVVRVSWQADSSATPIALSTVTDDRGAFSIPCVARGVVLSIEATHGALRAGPTRVGPITSGSPFVEIEFGPAKGADR